MKPVSRGIDRIAVTFDEPSLVADAGLIVPATVFTTARGRHSALLSTLPSMPQPLLGRINTSDKKLSQQFLDRSSTSKDIFHPRGPAPLLSQGGEELAPCLTFSSGSSR